MTWRLPPLPDETAAVLRALHADAAASGRPFGGSSASRRLDRYMQLLAVNGWSLRSIGEPIGLTRERVRQRIVRAETSAGGSYADLPSVPLPPPPPAPEPKAPKVRRLRIRPEVAERLRAMHAACRSVNGAVRADDPRRAVAVEFTALLQSLVEQGVSVSHIAKTLGVTHLAVRARLARHGYREPCPSMAHHTYKGHAVHEQVTA